MLCKYPFVPKGKVSPVACGQCLPCRINKRRVWTLRMLLEASSHTHNSFLTLTYNDDNLPEEFHDKDTGEIYSKYSVVPAHHRKFINSLQVDFKRKTGNKLSYYMCAEYGEKTSRPHYHYALFGFPTCTRLDERKKQKRFTECGCNNCQYLQKKWGKGHIFLGDLTQDSAQYVGGYVTKKLTNADSDYVQKVLQGRYVEFARMSKNPAVGLEAWHAHLDGIEQYIETAEDIPRYLSINGKKWPIGQYLLTQAKERFGFDEDEDDHLWGASYKARKERKDHEKLLSMFKDKTLTSEQEALISKGLPLRALDLLNSQKVLSMETKHSFKQHNKKEF